MIFFMFNPKIGEDAHFDDHILFQKRVGSTTKTQMFCVQSYVKHSQHFVSLAKNRGLPRSDRWRRHHFGDLAPLRTLGCCLASSHHGRGGGPFHLVDLVVEWFLGVIEMSSFCKLKSILFFWKLEFWRGYIYICMYIFMYTYIYISQENSRNIITFNRQQLIVCSMETSSLVYTPLNSWKQIPCPNVKQRQVVAISLLGSRYVKIVGSSKSACPCVGISWNESHVYLYSIPHVAHSWFLMGTGYQHFISNVSGCVQIRC